MTDNLTATTAGPEGNVTPLRHLEDHAAACLAASAVGDALGGATEGWSPSQIKERWGGWISGVVEHYYLDGWKTIRPGSPFHKADGNFTDDTIMTHLFAEVYIEQRRHLDAYDIAEHLVPKILTQEIYIPELERRGYAIERVFLAEKFPVLRLEYANIDPREAGVGNMVNCGAAMYISPTGIVNAGDPSAAYAEAIDLSAAHQLSYGREAAGVLAGAIAEALTPGATAGSVAEVALRLAHDGTRAAIDSVMEAAQSVGHWTEAIESGVLRDAVRPFDTVSEVYRSPGLGARRPSRIHAIEELPIALGLVSIAKGDVRDSVLGGVNYGRDADSIASMAGAISGALHGTRALPRDLVDDVATASRTDLYEPGLRLAAATRDIRSADLARSEVLGALAKRIFSA